MSAKLTVQDLLSKSDRVFKPKVAALVSTSASFQANDGFEQAMILHNNAVSVKEGLEMLTTDVSNIQRPVSLEDGRKALKYNKELQVSWNTVVDHAINKKPFFDALPVGNISAILAEDLKMTYAALLGLANALLEATPVELEKEAKTLVKEYEDAIKRAIAIYQ